jgi:hypothetical protein
VGPRVDHEGLTETAKLAAIYINAEDDQLKGLQKFLVEIVGFLSGTPQTHTIAQSSHHFVVAVLKEKRVYVKLARAKIIAGEFKRIDKYVTHGMHICPTRNYIFASPHQVPW